MRPPGVRISQVAVTAADAPAFASDQRLGQSVVKVVSGEKLSGLRALQALLIPGHRYMFTARAMGYRVAATDVARGPTWSLPWMLHRPWHRRPPPPG